MNVNELGGGGCHPLYCLLCNNFFECFYAPTTDYVQQRGIVFSLCLSRCLSRRLSSANSGLPARSSSVTGRRSAIVTLGQHAVCVGESIPVPRWTYVHYTDAAAKHQMTAGGLQLSRVIATICWVKTAEFDWFRLVSFSDEGVFPESVFRCFREDCYNLWLNDVLMQRAAER